MEIHIVPLFGDDRLMADVRFCEGHGWEWAVRHYDVTGWNTLDSGLARTYRAALSELQRCIGELAG